MAYLFGIIVMFTGFAIGGWYIEKQEKSQGKAERKANRHADDNNKLFYTGQINYLYYKYF